MQTPDHPFTAVPINLSEQLRRAARLHPTRTAIIHQGQIVSYEELDELVDRFSSHLHRKGLRPGGRVLFALTRKPELVISFLAIARLGGIAVPLDWRCTLEEIQAIRNLVNPCGTIHHAEMTDQIGRLSQDEWSVRIDPDRWKDDLGVIDPTLKYPTMSDDDPVYLNFTSGSTGRPKAAIATYRNLHTNTLASCIALRITSNDVHLPLFAVMSHPHESFCRSLFTGGASVLLDSIYPRAIARAISDHQITCTMAVPPIYEMLLPFADSPAFSFRSLRVPEAGGMATSSWLRDRFSARFGVPLVPVWGSTESMGIAFASPPNGPVPDESCGRLLPYYDARILGSDGQDAPDGEPGELALRGDGITRGYWQATHENQIVFQDGWYRTGDVFRQDKEGFYYCIGRKDNMIKVGGLKVYPGEIEAQLILHPAVREAVVVPFQDKLRGMVPLAAVVLKPGESTTEGQLRQFLSKRLPKAKIPRVFRFLTGLPRIGSGKINFTQIGHSIEESAVVTDREYEQMLDSIDIKLLNLLNERLKITLNMQSGNVRLRYSPERLEETIRKLQEYNSGPMHDSVVEQIFRLILSIPQYM